MGYSVFFSFHYDDVKSFRANVVRNCHRFTKFNGLFTDSSMWENGRPKTPTQVKKIINESELTLTDITVVLIGQKTYERRWVKYEIIKSFEQGNTLLGIHINRIKGKEKKIVPKGKNPFDRLGFKYKAKSDTLYFYELADRKWRPFKDLPSVRNHKSNSVFIKDIGFWDKLFGRDDRDKFYTLSDFFQTYTWKVGEHNAESLTQWFDNSHEWIMV
jgi:hypothetical protein